MIDKLQKKVEKLTRRRKWTQKGNKCRIEKWKDFCWRRLGVVEYESRKMMYKNTRLSLMSSSKRDLFIDDFSAYDLHSLMDDDSLQRSGQRTLLRFLTVFQHTIYFSDDICMEILTSLSSMLLYLMHEEEAFACISALLSSNDHFTLFKRRSSDCGQCKEQNPLYNLLLDSHQFPNLSHLRQECGEVHWRKWVACDLPYAHLTYIFHCFLSEGVCVACKVASCLVKMWYDQKGSKFDHKRVSVEAFEDEMSDFCRNIAVTPQDLLKMAFATKQRRRSSESDDQKSLRDDDDSVKSNKSNHGRSLSIISNDKKLSTDDDSSAKVVCSLAPRPSISSVSSVGIDWDFLKSSKILTREQMLGIYRRIPVRHHLKEVNKVYSTDEDGISFIKFWTLVEPYSPTILLIKTTKNEIFGAFCGESWSNRRRVTKIKYFGTGETFLFKYLSPLMPPKNDDDHCPDKSDAGQLCFYPWVGKELSVDNLKPDQELFQAASESCLLLGGGAICIRNSLTKGSSDAASTFLNPPLSIDSDFDIELLEVFGFC